jgi:ABC-type transport system involved in multi-copper enzyme maturation permease subunit
MSMNRVTLSLARMNLIAGNTFHEAVRQRLLPLMILVAAAMAGGALLFRDFHFGSSEWKFVLDVGFGALTFFGAILSIVASAQLFFSEIERRTVLAVLAKPVWRAEFILGKLGGVLLLLLVYCVLVTTVLAGLLWWGENALGKADPGAFEAGRTVAYAGVVWCGLVQWLKLGVLAALTLLVASYARSSLFAILAGFGALVICQLQSLARDCYGMTDSSLTRGGLELLGLVFPNFQLFDVTDRVAAGGTLSFGLVGGIAAYALAYLGVYSGLSVYCFRNREL